MPKKDYDLLARVCKVFLRCSCGLRTCTCTLWICSCLVSCETLWTTYECTLPTGGSLSSKYARRYIQYVCRSRSTWHSATHFSKIVCESVNEDLDIHVEKGPVFAWISPLRKFTSPCDHLRRIRDELVTFLHATEHVLHHRTERYSISVITQ